MCFKPQNRGPLFREGINRLIREHETGVEDWEHQELVTTLYTWFDRFNVHFFEGKLPRTVISVERTRVTRLGHFVPDRDAIGVRNRINVNAKYAGYDPWFSLRTLAHEMVHVWEQAFGKPGKNNYHTRAFRRKAAEIGILCDERGRVINLPADPFVSLLKQFGVEVAELPPSRGSLGRLRGESRLQKYSCQCPINVWAADRRFAGTCQHCGKEFKPA